MLSRAHACGSIKRLCSGVYAPAADIPDSDWDKYVLFAHAFATRGRILAGVAASAVLGMWRITAFPPFVENYRGATTRRRDSTDAYDKQLLSPLPPEHQTRVGDSPVTTPARTVIDILRRHGLEPALIAAASFAATYPQADMLLARCVAECRELRLRGLSGAEDLIRHSSVRLDSALEAIFYAQVVTRGGFEVHPQATFRVNDRKYRVDFLVVGTTLVVELDGRAKYGDTPTEQLRVLEAEKDRANALYSQHGLTILRFNYREVVSGEAYTRVLRAVREYRASGPFGASGPRSA